MFKIKTFCKVSYLFVKHACSTFVGYHHSAGAAKRSNKVFRKDHFYKKPFWLNHLHWLGSCKSLEILAGVKS